jgi:hypothetical protein
MKKNVVTWAAMLAVAAGLWWLWRRGDEAEMPRPEMGRMLVEPKSETWPRKTAGDAARVPAGLTAAEKAARIEQIKRDYDEVRARVAADYTAAGASFPGGLNAFLRQLALLEREKRADFATFLTPQELEDLEYRETTAGQLVQRLLAGGEMTDEQRRAAFRLQLAFDDRYALIFDLAPPVLLEREKERQQLQQRIRAAIGDAAFAAWLKGEGGDFEKFAGFVAEQGLARERAFDLWELKNEFIRRRLEFGAQKLPAEQVRALQAELTREMQARLVGILGPGASELAQREVLGWLPR